MRAPGGLGHLMRRFLGAIVSRYPSPPDQLFVAGLLGEEEAGLFWRQETPDLAHAVVVARRLLAAHPGRSDLARAALLHDVGKIRARLGTLGRSVASVLEAAHLPLAGRMSTYANHGEAGARMLEDIGLEGIAVYFARHHRTGPPDDVDPEDWEALRAADDV